MHSEPPVTNPTIQNNNPKKIELLDRLILYFISIDIYTFQNESPYKEKLADSTYNTI